MKRSLPKMVSALFIIQLVLLWSGCGITPSPSPSPTAVYTQYQLEYRLFAKYGDVFW